MGIQNSNEASALGEVLAGAGIGLLVGLLVGLSVSEVVGGVIGGLTALLAAFFGLSGKQKSGSTERKAVSNSFFRAWRVAAFGFVCSAAVILGIFIRTHNILGNTPAKQLRTWIDAGYSKDIARELVAYQLLGVAPKGLRAVKDEHVIAKNIAALFSKELNSRSRSQCSELMEKLYRDPTEWANAFVQAGGGWQEVGEVVQSLDKAKKREVLTAVWQLVCEKNE